MKKKNRIGEIAESIAGFIMILIIYKFVKNPDNIINFKSNGSMLAKQLLEFGIGIIAISFIIRFVKYYRKKQFYLKSGISEIDKFSGIEFENLLAIYFKELGYKVKMTPITNDYGADLVLHKDKECVVVQAKRYNSKVGIAAIQQIIAAKGYYKADRSIVATNNYYTKQALNLAKECQVELIDRDKLIKIMASVNGKEKIEDAEKIICSKCGAVMIKKKGKYGEFWGCSNYPNCKNIINIKRRDV